MKLDENTAIAFSEIDSAEKYQKVSDVFEKLGYQGFCKLLDEDLVLKSKVGFFYGKDGEVHFRDGFSKLDSLRMSFVSYKVFTTQFTQEPAPAQPFVPPHRMHDEAVEAMTALGYRYDHDVGKWYTSVREYVNND